MRRFFFLVSAVFAATFPASAANGVYIHTLHFMIVNEHIPCTEFRVGIAERQGGQYGTRVYWVSGPPFNRKTERMDLPKTMLPHVVVTANAGTVWDSRHQICSQFKGSARAEWQTSVLTPPDSNDLAPFYITFTADRKLTITPEK